MIFYKKDIGHVTGGAAIIEDWQNDKDFNKILEYLYPQEGGYSNRKADLGGPTKLGVTQFTYDWYNKRNKIPTQNVKNITKGEATKIYYDYFWKESGASSIKDKVWHCCILMLPLIMVHIMQKNIIKKQMGIIISLLNLEKNIMSV